MAAPQQRLPLANDDQAARVLAADAKQAEEPSEEEKRRMAADEQLPSACEVIAEVVARLLGADDAMGLPARELAWLRESGVLKVAMGLTTIEVVLRVT